MKIQLANSDAEIAACFPVMKELRPHLGQEEFVERVLRQQASGYRIACLDQEDAPVAVAGFRLGENLAWGRFLYVDDLVTASSHRSRGYGAALLEWLKAYAIKQGCHQLHLDSGMQREDAHRFYEREGVTRTGFHFAMSLEGDREPTRD